MTDRRRHGAWLHASGVRRRRKPHRSERGCDDEQDNCAALDRIHAQWQASSVPIPAPALTAVMARTMTTTDHDPQIAQALDRLDVNPSVII
jgi:hypothetical protein